jgi:hypothetical protein
MGGSLPAKPLGYFMTETEIKLKDARIQLELAMSRETVLNIDVVRSCINAFISAARSVTFTMQKESGSSTEFLDWYENKQLEMKNDPLSKFFNEQRVISIHHRSVQPNQRTINITEVERDGRPVDMRGIAMVYEFDDYENFKPGDNGNVFRLCTEYLDYLEQLVNEWKQIVSK